MSDLIIRPLREGEFPLFDEYGPMPASGVGARARTFDEEVAAGNYRPEWIWIAERGPAVVARVAFWAPPGERYPWSVDRFDPGTGPDRVEVGAALLQAAYAALVPPDYSVAPHPDGGRPDYHLFLPADWRDRPDARADAADRIAAAERAGLTLFVERLNLRWTPADGLPPRPGRLRFRPATEHRDAVAPVLARLCTDTLDAYAARDVARYGLARAAAITVDELADLPGSPGWDWWRLAYAPDGELVGIVMPTRNPTCGTIGYVGVVPEHRGNHYIDDLVIEAQHIFTAAGERTVNDGTDVANAPMAASFARCNYRVTGRRVILA